MCVLCVCVCVCACVRVCVCVRACVHVHVTRFSHDVKFCQSMAEVILLLKHFQPLSSQHLQPVTVTCVQGRAVCTIGFHFKGARGLPGPLTSDIKSLPKPLTSNKKLAWLLYSN